MPPVVLLIEDEDDDQRLFGLALRRLQSPWQLRVCGRVDEALSVMAREPINICVVDLNLPNDGGLRFMRQARELDVALGVPMLVLSTSRAVSDMAAAFAAGCASYFVKPAGIDELVALLQAIDQYWFGAVALNDQHLRLRS